MPTFVDVTHARRVVDRTGQRGPGLGREHGAFSVAEEVAHMK